MNTDMNNGATNPNPIALMKLSLFVTSSVSKLPFYYGSGVATNITHAIMKMMPMTNFYWSFSPKTK